METLTEQEVISLGDDTGHCTNCKRAIKIYRYSINRVMAGFMLRMHNHIATNGGINNVDIMRIGMVYSVHSQSTKLRLHGLIARVKNEHGDQIANRWLITAKGYKFIYGQPVQKTVNVYNNQNLGYQEGMITIDQAFGESCHLVDPAVAYEESPITEAESRVFSDLREAPKKRMFVQAQFIGHDYFNSLEQKSIYRLEIKQLQLGKPVKIEVQKPIGDSVTLNYVSMSAFQGSWKILKEEP